MTLQLTFENFESYETALHVRRRAHEGVRRVGFGGRCVCGGVRVWVGGWVGVCISVRVCASQI